MINDCQPSTQLSPAQVPKVFFSVTAITANIMKSRKCCFANGSTKDLLIGRSTASGVRQERDACAGLFRGKSFEELAVPRIVHDDAYSLILPRSIQSDTSFLPAYYIALFMQCLMRESRLAAIEEPRGSSCRRRHGTVVPCNVRCAAIVLSGSRPVRACNAAKRFERGQKKNENTRFSCPAVSSAEPTSLKKHLTATTTITEVDNFCLGGDTVAWIFSFWFFAVSLIEVRVIFRVENYTPIRLLNASRSHLFAPSASWSSPGVTKLIESELNTLRREYIILCTSLGSSPDPASRYT